MRHTLTLLSLFCVNSLFCQESILDKNIQELKQKIEETKGAQRLIWMDSLSNVFAFDTDYRNDSITRATINFAKELDSINITVSQTSNLIYHLNNIKGTPRESVRVISETQPLLSSVSKPKVACKFYYETGNTYYYLSEFEAALPFYDSVTFYAEKSNNIRFLGLAKLGKGQVYTDMGEFGQASLTLQDAIRFFQRYQDTTRMMEARNSLTILYSKNGFYKEAQEERNEIINHELAKKSYDMLPAFYFNAAADDNKMGDQEQRIVHLKLALEGARKSRFSGYYSPIMLSGLAVAYAQTDSVSLAETYLKELESDLEKNTTGPYRGYYLDVLRNIAYAKKEYINAVVHGEAYLEEKKNSAQYEEIQEAENFLYKAHSALGNKGKALDHFEQYTKIKDSVEDIQKTRVLSYYQTLYETEKRDLRLKAQEDNISFLNERGKVRMQWFLIGSIGLIGLFGIIFLMRSRNFARKKQKLQESFTQDLLQTQENERARIASELHDNVGQKLLLVKNSLLAAQLKTDTEINMVGETIKEVREMSHNLHPFQFEKVGLEQSLRNMIASFQKNSNIFYSEDIKNVDGAIPKEKEIVIFRMLQECITNVEKHSEASACNLSTNKQGDSLLFVLKDNGKGFDTPNNAEAFGGLGMKTLKERAQLIDAQLEIDSTLTQGTIVSIKISTK